MYRALADPTRRRVLALLRERDMTAGELAAEFDLSWPTMSGHFTVLREADLISADFAVVGTDDPRAMARQALTGLGFTPQEADNLLRRVAGDSAEELIEQALRMRAAA